MSPSLRCSSGGDTDTLEHAEPSEHERLHNVEAIGDVTRIVVLQKRCTICYHGRSRNKRCTSCHGRGRKRWESRVFLNRPALVLLLSAVSFSPSHKLSGALLHPRLVYAAPLSRTNPDLMQNHGGRCGSWEPHREAEFLQ